MIPHMQLVCTKDLFFGGKHEEARFFCLGNSNIFCADNDNGTQKKVVYLLAAQI